jgi:DNA-binding NarL/FixJ family response regulator
MTLRIVLADDHRLIREGLRALLARESDMEVVGLAEDGATALRLVRQLQPDILVTDLAMPGLNGIEAIRRLRAGHEAVRIVCVSMHVDQRSVVSAIDAGASGYVPKDASGEELAQAVRHVASGQIHLSPALMSAVIDEVRWRRHPSSSARQGTPAKPTLTSREREVVQLFSEDLSSQAIADRLHLSVKTIATHREHVVRKLGVRGVAGLTRYAMREGLCTLEAPSIQVSQPEADDIGVPL